ncbi:MAG: protease family protein [Mycobacterium sp.]|nr:protease family protein [Mycobacterium sp.]
MSPRLPTAWRVVLQAAVGALLVLATGARLGLRLPALRSGLQIGSAAAAAAGGAIAVTAWLPPVRAAMAGREVPASVPGWLLVRIPLGTVWAEEAAFRGALGSAASEAFGRHGGRALQAIAFGLSHVVDARSAGEPVIPTVLVTGVVGWLFGWLAERSGSLAAPMLVHLAINETGAVAALTVRRITL